MQLQQLWNAAPAPYGAQEVTSFVLDHRKIAQGSVFGAFRGARVHGEDYIEAAIAAGAIAVVASPQAHVRGAAHIATDTPRKTFAELAAQFYAPYPAHICAVTGTNGKTSCVELARQLWRMAGHRAASIGTLGVTTADGSQSTGLTSPDIVTFLANMAGLQREGVSHVAFEASSHGLHQYRTQGVAVQVAAFTNFSRDHLDYHGDMESYFQAKLRLFEEVVQPHGTAVIWRESESAWAARVEVVAHARKLHVISIGRSGSTIELLERTPHNLGQKLKLRIAGKETIVNLPLIGAYQAANALTAAAMVCAAGGDMAATLANLARLQPVRGRLEQAVITRSGAPVFVDYAHTPDALEAACAALRPHCQARLLLVFGAGGDRDQGKRPLLGQAAAQCADVAIITNDNPRTEDPHAIRAAIQAQAPHALNIGDRREAIATAMRMASPQDIVLIAGKGHETGQIIGEKIIPFDDVHIARDIAGESA
jgi:UDP-N-acetylmuramoyl-L-alanyl-D-glutamate--2,6-diaminopimelate ligase